MPTPPPGYLSVLPRGLLAFLQIKNEGRNPGALAGELQPTFDLMQWYLATNLESFGVVSVAVGAGTNIETALAGLTVPDREFWYVYDYRARFQCGAATTCTELQLQYFEPIGGALSGYVMNDIVTNLVATDIKTVSAFKRQIFVPPGGALGFSALAVVGVNANITARARVARLPI